MAVLLRRHHRHYHCLLMTTHHLMMMEILHMMMDQNGEQIGKAADEMPEEVLREAEDIGRHWGGAE